MHALPDFFTTRMGLRGCALLLALPLATQAQAQTEPSDWSLGIYGGQYQDTEPAGAIAGRANYLSQYLLAVTGSKTLWRSSSWPLAIELDAMIGQQWGQASLTEVAIAPAVRWSGFPWRDVLRTDLRLAPLGISYTNRVSPLELGANSQGSRTLNYLFVEVAVSRPQSPEHEFFVRLHHRCAIYDLLNSYGANGEDFTTIGYRFKF